MKSLIKSAVIIGQVLGLFMGDESTAPSWKCQNTTRMLLTGFF